MTGIFARQGTSQGHPEPEQAIQPGKFCLIDHENHSLPHAQGGKPEFQFGNVSSSPLLPVPGEVFGLRKLIPMTSDYDFNIHIMDFKPGEHLNVKVIASLWQSGANLPRPVFFTGVQQLSYPVCHTCPTSQKITWTQGYSCSTRIPWGLAGDNAAAAQPR
jgi:hypothetical protein